MENQGWSLVLYFYLSAIAAAEWIVMHSTLPTVSTEHPEVFVVNLVWVDEDNEKTTNITLSLEKSEAVGKKIPYFKNNEKGTPVLTSFIDMKHTTFYQDLQSQASISLTSFGNKEFSLKGSVIVGDGKYDIEPYHPTVHKRSLGARASDHIVKRRSPDERKDNTDYKMPEKGSEDYDRVQRAEVRFRALQEMEGRKKRSAEENDQPTDYKVWQAGSRDGIGAASSKVYRKRRDTLSNTTYTVEIYMMIDYYLYLTLKESAEVIEWPGGVDDYIAFFMAHQANEIDVIYRGIHSGGHPVYGSWTIGTKLSYLNVATTTSGSPWTHPPTDLHSMQLDARIGFQVLTNWVNTTPNLPAADHYMLITGLDLVLDGNPGVDGYTDVEGICGKNRTSLNQFSSSRRYAHELGHNLGAYDDGEGGNHCSEEDQYVMAAVTSATATPATIGNYWIFSRCSVKYFDAYLSTLNEDRANCLLNPGEYISSWHNYSSMHFGQKIDADEQCRIWWGEGYYYARDNFDSICDTLECTNDTSPYIYSNSNEMTLQYTSCGNKKWCVNSICTYDAVAPEIDETCPFEDKEGPVFTNLDVTCAELNSYLCKYYKHTQLYCCRACSALATPWLGPNCTYGDTLDSTCFDLNTAEECIAYSDSCCQTCCPYLGPAEGYSCMKPSTTTTPTTTTPTTTTPTTTTTTTPTTTTTTTPTTTTATTTTPTTTATLTKETVTSSATNSTFSITNKATATFKNRSTTVKSIDGKSQGSLEPTDDESGGFSPAQRVAVFGGIGAGIAVVVIVGVMCAKREQLRGARVNCCRAKDEDFPSVAYIAMT